MAASNAHAGTPVIHLPTCTQVWEPLGTGCAREIAVGPNNVPWVLGCPGGSRTVSGPSSVYYLSYESNGNLIETPTWVNDGFSDAIDIFVNMNGAPWVSGADGQFYAQAQQVNASNVVVPSTDWLRVPESYAGDMGSTVVSANNTNTPGVNAGMLFYPLQGVDYANPYDLNTVWSMGCGSACSRGPFNPLSNNPDGNIFTSNFEFFVDYSSSTLDTYTSPWTHLPGAAIQVSLFTDPPVSGTLGNGSNTVQNPWVVTSEGAIYFWNQGEYTWVRAPFFPDGYQSALWLTDHYALDDASNVWAWTGPSSGGSSSAQWQLVSGLSGGATNPGVPYIVQIAFSQQASGNYVGQPSSPIGPSQIWGIDWNGSIYSSAWKCAIQ
jgi:hypothetical protein